MVLRNGQLALRAGVLLGFAFGASAVPSVNVALRTSFDAPPYLLELLETAAEENATSYFPLLDRIAEGTFDSASTDEQLYNQFRALLQQDGHLSQAQDLSSFDFALSIHSAAPRIEAYYQYYNTSVKSSIGRDEQDGCESWVHTPFSGQRYCSPELEARTAKALGQAGDVLHSLPFDRVLGDEASGKEAEAVVYADITSESFRKFHQIISKTAKEGKASYRVRYKPGMAPTSRPLRVSGYGVELALKRTDYIVIDDRQAEDEKEQGKGASEATLNEEEISDLRPLSASELRRLGLKAASFVMASEQPFDTLVKLSQDFPKHSGAIAAMNVSDEFRKEHVENRGAMLPSGYNVIWINGVQIMARDLDAYSLLEHLRRERKMISGVRELGLSGPEAIDLLSHEAITESHTAQEAERYDWRDDMEGGQVIMWLNDIEKDKRYAEWPDTVSALMQRTYPGQIPPVRKNIHTGIIPVDFADPHDAEFVGAQLINFVNRKIPIRFGLVPMARTQDSLKQAILMYHLLDTYGLSAAIEYLIQSVEGAGKNFGPPQAKYFAAAIKDRKLRKDCKASSVDEVLTDEKVVSKVNAAGMYRWRLGLDADTPPVLVNGVPIVKSDEWLQHTSQRVGSDLRVVQKAVFEEEVTDESYLPDLFLLDASPRRVPIIIPEDDRDIKHLDLNDLPELANLPSIPANLEPIERELVHLTLVADVDNLSGFAQLMEALIFKQNHDSVELALLSRPEAAATEVVVERPRAKYGKKMMHKLLAKCNELAAAELKTRGLEARLSYPDRQVLYKRLFDDLPREAEDDGASATVSTKRIESALNLQPSERALVLNGRVVGPLQGSSFLGIDDFETLLSYERKKRLSPASLAVEGLQLGEKMNTPFAFARISNLIALSQVSDVPEGIFEAAPTVRSSIYKQWNSTHTAVKVGDVDNATIQIVASIDPASETAQRWIPIVKALSELDGVYTCLFLNPRERLDELPVKRFYRHVLESKPAFEQDGSLRGVGASFAGLPAEALLNMGMDLPPSWLVAPKESVHDLDNIKLSAVKSDTDIDAIYELEHILIEGHSKDVTSGPPPRGAQLVLSTEHDSYIADTIVMANLGYFQFKANPGIYNLALQKGRSEEIFNIESAGTMGYGSHAGDGVTEIALASFRGSTLFPRISRKPGMELEDVLEPSKSTIESLAEGADRLLAQAGLFGNGASKYLSKAMELGSSLFSGSDKSVDASTEPQAEINIFSVASGHLYERMLNIMMLSVMKHTEHTVKFWFIEQFLSPSFKDFLPILAAEHGFKYEMVTYKWPHWLRGQKEKQREIWGYKILFLDVLFPLDLDKVIFVDADQIVRTDMHALVQHDLHGAPYGFTPMCDSRTEMEGFRFWKQGYWKNFLRGLPYHISALYVVDLKRFRQMAAGDRLRQQYHQLSADPNSLSNLDQDLPNHMQMALPIHSLPQEWLWCETWCSDEALKEAKTIDLCNNPQTKEPKLDRARRQVPEWTVYDEEISGVARRHKAKEGEAMPVAGSAEDVGAQGVEESIQERLQREDAERERREGGHDEL